MIRTIEQSELRWINIVNPSHSEMEGVAREYGFHPLDLEAVMTPAGRSRFEAYDRYIFVTLLFPIFDRKTREIRPSKIDIFFGHNFLITVHNEQLEAIVDFFSLMSMNTHFQEKYCGSLESLLYELLNKLLIASFPMLDHINLEIEGITGGIFSGKEQHTIKEISLVRRKIIDFHKIMQAHKNTFEKMILVCKDATHPFLHDFAYFDRLVSYTKEIWDILENFKERIEALQETNDSLISSQINTVIRMLSFIAVVILPGVIMAALFGANILHVPWANQPYGFWILVGILVVLMFATVVFFKKKKWW